MGKRGTVVIPNQYRKALGLEEGDLMILELREDGVLLRPAMAVPVENYTSRRKAELLLHNALDAKDYQAARVEVKRMGFDPDSIPHLKPANL